MIAKGQHLLIRRPNAKKNTEAGILLPDQYGKQYSYGKVVSVGPKACDICGPVEEGEHVVFDAMGGVPLELDPMKDAELIVAHASQVFCVIHPKQLEARKLPVE